MTLFYDFNYKELTFKVCLSVFIQIHFIFCSYNVYTVYVFVSGDLV